MQKLVGPLPRAFVLIVSVGALSACNNGGAVVQPSTGYLGQWAGTTSQGQPVAFSVNDKQQVVSLTIGYNFNNCSGTLAWSDLSLPIFTPQPPGAPPYNNPGFGYSSQSQGTNGIAIVGVFTSDTTALGTFDFLVFTACGGANSGGNWTASKR
jgi:hypothetical protein